MTRVLVAMGSNIDAERNLRRAVDLLSARCQVVAVSAAYETEPVGGAQVQPRYLNAAAALVTELSAARLKDDVLATVEQALGRVRVADRYAPRPIDLDIALFGDEVLDVGARHIPDPDILLHAHVAVPLADVAPTVRHPEDGRTLAEIAASLPRDGVTRRVGLVLWPAGHDGVGELSSAADAGAPPWPGAST
jgi:2-amino-4-hydroxy-6-hydroxymethyldihydropteridine diphosphokinase